MYKEQLAYGKTGCPFGCPHYSGQVEYRPGLCPTTEAVEASLIATEFARPPCDLGDMQDVVDGFVKVYENRQQLAR